MEPIETILFVTGKLAEPSLRKVINSIQETCKFESLIDVLPITVAALMTPEWIAKRIHIPDKVDRIILPGFCDADLTPIKHLTDAKIEIGPKDLRFLPEHFGLQIRNEVLTQFDIEILAEINHAPRLSLDEIVRQAKHYADSGADVIDIGCEVDHLWSGVGDCVKAIRDIGLRVSIDSLNPAEIQKATDAGAELVLSVNSSNISFASDFGAEVVLIPDEPDQWQRIEANIEKLESASVPYRVDPIIEPVGMGFAASLQRYMNVRERWPELPMMMGIGNLTEMTEVDSAGVNLILLAICQELKIYSVLTTEVISWARTSVRECEIARRLVRHSVVEQTPPKHVDSSLVLLRDSIVRDLEFETLAEMASRIKDSNYRIFADEGELHLIGGGHHFHDTDPFKLFDRLKATEPRNLSPSHAFYLGYELQKAAVALQLGKQYTQDEALNWGFLTVEEKNRHRLSRRNINELGDQKKQSPDHEDMNPQDLEPESGPE